MILKSKNKKTTIIIMLLAVSVALFGETVSTIKFQQPVHKLTSLSRMDNVDYNRFASLFARYSYYAGYGLYFASPAETYSNN